MLRERYGNELPIFCLCVRAMAPTQIAMEDLKPPRPSTTTGGGGSNKNWGRLEANKAGDPVWLMKCPPNVAKSFKPHADSGAVFGSEPCSSGPVAKVILSLDPLNSNTEPKFTMELAATDSVDTPKCYILDMSRDFVPMSVFSESAEGKLSVEGKIFNKFDMKPKDENLENYGKLCRERTKKHMKSRKIQVIENDNGLHMRPMPGQNLGFVASGPSEKKKAPTKGSEMKRTRRDRGEMEAIMFKLFERQSNWTLRQLIQETDQPEQFLKDILKDLSVYNNKGANQGTYELKPEYRRTSDDAAP